ncbi:hypothetical protein [Ectobacillus ponti]|uniref:Uncharacterized protein n=1 Tax=Ectobacillus ponti TaxID=2961894 RepID=A0AA41X719_9BACI|nr:hypothetical protein [Ectobacillus ponti]MCP8970116.1 hypothetical protein [Ectobacillus ponti]
MKRLLIVFAILAVGLLGYYVTVLAPYNLIGVWKARSLGMLNGDSFKDIEELATYFKGHDIQKVKYLGNDSYEVFTDKGEFVIIADYSDSMYWRYKIFKFDKKAEYFTNPM